MFVLARTVAGAASDKNDFFLGGHSVGRE